MALNLDKLWFENILACLRELSDPGFQQRVWIRGEGPEVSSYAEAVCGLYDDSGLADELFGAEAGKPIVTEVVDQALRDLDEALPEAHGTASDAHIVSLPSWPRVIVLATSAAQLVEQEMRARYG